LGYDPRRRPSRSMSPDLAILCDPPRDACRHGRPAKATWIAIPSALSCDPVCPITRSRLPYHAIPSALSRDPICPITRSHLPYHAIPSALSRDPICPITRSHLPYHAIPSALSRDPICPITRSHLPYHAICVASSTPMPRNPTKCIVTAIAGIAGMSLIHCRMALGLDAPEQTVSPRAPRISTER
jgi:hypothetical protein